MEYKLFQNNLEDANKLSKYLLMVCGLQFLIVFILVILSIALSHRQMVALIPMNLNSPMSVSNNVVSSQYLDESALSFIDLRLNFDPDTIDNNHQVILRFVSPGSYKKIKSALDQESKLVKSQGISSSFYINKIKVNKQSLSVMISGTLNRAVVDKQLIPVKATFLITFENDDGLLSINQFVEEKE